MPAGVRRTRAAALRVRTLEDGRDAQPVVLSSRKITNTFWGTAWCRNLESYSDFSNRLPRGRTYVRNGSVIHLELAEGKVSALVTGGSVYEVSVSVKPLPPRRWRAICSESASAIGSLVELLQGRLADGVMQRICDRETGLFPMPAEIDFTCTCPDWAYMCKHVAAVMYGVGARLDERPELLFRLRGVNELDLVADVGVRAAGSVTGSVPESTRVLRGGDLEELFGLQLRRYDDPEVVADAGDALSARTGTSRTRAGSGAGAKKARGVKKKK
jgi:hypothetical protein